MENFLNSISKLGLLKKIPKGSFIFHSENKANGFYYIESGIISIFKMDAQGKEIEINQLSKGDYLGEVILFASDTFPVSAKVVTDSKIIYFPKNRILNEINNNPEAAKSFLSLLSKKCITLNKRIETLSLKTVKQRLIQYLLSSCKGSLNCTIELSITKSELAKNLGTINETLSRNLKQLQDEKLIKINKNKIHITNCILLKKEISSI